MKANAVLNAGWLLLCLATVVQGAAGFQGLGDLPGGSFESKATVVTTLQTSGETVVYGASSGSAGLPIPFRWEQSSGMVQISGFYSPVNAASSLSSPGLASAVGSNYYSEPVYWDSTGQIETLPVGSFSEGAATAVSDDTSTIYGYCADASGNRTPAYWQAIYSHQSQTWYYQGPGEPSYAWELQGSLGLETSWVTDLADGIGAVCGNGGAGFGWEAEQAWVALGGAYLLDDTLGGTSGSSDARAISDNGSVVVGVWLGLPVRWTADWDSYYDAPDWSAGGDLAVLSQGGGSALDVSADGSVIVGETGGNAFVWDEDHGPRLLRDVLELDCGLDLTGWTLASATAITDDGETIVGYGTNPSGATEAWIATIPEPSTMTWVAFGILGALSRRRAFQR